MNLSDHNVLPEPVSASSSAAGHGMGAIVAEASRRLQTVSDRLKQFLQQKLVQFETAARQCEQVLAQRHSLTAMRKEIAHEKSDWDQQRQQQVDEIRREQDRLIEAWRNMEHEQRRMLAQQELPRQQTAPRDVSIPAAPPATAEAVVTASPSTAGFDGGSVFVEPTRQVAPAAVALSREDAMDQFRRLKQECRKHVERVQPNAIRN
ncbi:MAG: hypothetical protein ACE5KM_02240 [Planctomycetaceae bacterium]